jgi:tRNA(Ile)-lysidine synthase
MVLLHALAALRAFHPYSLSAVHVHHGLSPQADVWVAHCQAACDALDIPLSVARVDVRPVGQGLEAAAREARYRIFAQLDADALALAHHRDDQTETVLLQMLRGASARGMAAMPEARLLTGDIQLLRPFLQLTRGQLERYALDHGLTWIDDESNLDPSLARNHLRHTILPSLEEAAPGLTAAVARAAAQFAEWADLLDALADVDGAAGLGEDGLEVARLQALTEPRARNLLRRVLVRAGVQVRRQPLVEATRQLREAAHNAQLRIDFDDVSVVRFHNRARVVPRGVFAPVPPLAFLWQGGGEVDLGASGRLGFHQTVGEGAWLAGERIVIRHRQGGDRLRLQRSQIRRPLKDLLREAGIPPWQRPWLPVVEVDGQVAWVAGLGVAADFRAGPVMPSWAISWASPW